MYESMQSYLKKRDEIMRQELSDGIDLAWRMGSIVGFLLGCATCFTAYFLLRYLGYLAP